MSLPHFFTMSCAQNLLFGRLSSLFFSPLFFLLSALPTHGFDEEASQRQLLQMTCYAQRHYEISFRELPPTPFAPDDQRCIDLEIATFDELCWAGTALYDRILGPMQVDCFRNVLEYCKAGGDDGREESSSCVVRYVRDCSVEVILRL